MASCSRCLNSSRRRRLLEAHARVKTIVVEPPILRQHDCQEILSTLPQTAIPIENYRTIVVEQRPPALFDQIGFYFAAGGLSASRRKALTDVIVASGGFVYQEYSSAVTIVIIHDSVAMEDTPNPEHGLTRTPDWVSGIVRHYRASVDRPLSVFEYGSVQELSSIVSSFDAISKAFSLLGSHFMAHAYCQIRCGLQRYELHSVDVGASSKEALNGMAGFLPTNAVSVARYILVNGDHPPGIVDILSNPLQVLIMKVASLPLISPRAARRLVMRHRVRSIADIPKVTFLTRPQRACLQLSPQPLSRKLASKLIDCIQRDLPPDNIAIPCGAFRRRHAQIPFLFLIIVSSSFECPVLNITRSSLTVVDVLRQNSLECEVIVEYDDARYRVRLRQTSFEHRHFAVMNATGSDEFVRRWRWRARDLGFTVGNDDRLYRNGAEIAPATSERALFAMMGIEYIAPRFRDAFPIDGTTTALPMMRSWSFRPYPPPRRVAFKHPIIKHTANLTVS